MDNKILKFKDEEEARWDSREAQSGSRQKGRAFSTGRACPAAARFILQNVERVIRLFRAAKNPGSPMTRMPWASLHTRAHASQQARASNLLLFPFADPTLHRPSIMARNSASLRKLTKAVSDAGTASRCGMEDGDATEVLTSPCLHWRTGVGVLRAQHACLILWRHIPAGHKSNGHGTTSHTCW